MKFEWHNEFVIYCLAAIIIIAGVSKASALTTNSIYVNPDGLVRYYDFSDHTGTGITDRSDWTDTGVLTNTPSWVQGYYGAGLSFASASSQYGQSGGTLGISGASARTMSFWVKLVSASATNCIIGWGNGTATANNFYVFAYNTQWYMNWYGDDLYFGATNTNWNYIAITYDGAYIRTYVNGVYVSTATITLNTPNAKLELGRRTYDGNYLNGNLDEVKIWNRALSAEEIYVDYLGTYQLIEQYYANSTAIANLNSTVIAGFNAAAVNRTNMNATIIAGFNAAAVNGTNMNGTIISGFNNLTTFNSTENNTVAYMISLLNGMINNASISNSSTNNSIAYLKTALDALTVMQESANENMSIFNQSTNSSIIEAFTRFDNIGTLIAQMYLNISNNFTTTYEWIAGLNNISVSDVWDNDINRTTNCTNCELNVTTQVVNVTNETVDVYNNVTTNNYNNTVVNNYTYPVTIVVNDTNTTNNINNSYPVNIIVNDTNTTNNINTSVTNSYPLNLNRAQLRNISTVVWELQPTEDKTLLWFIISSVLAILIVLVALIIKRRWFK